jgi:hypothetical protein
VSMVEKVALAICGSLPWECPPGSPACKDCVTQARAAIEAMREPSEGMVKAAASTYVDLMQAGEPQWFRPVLRAALSAALKASKP